MGDQPTPDEVGSVFRQGAVSLWVEDVSALRTELARLREQGVRDIRSYLIEHPEFVRRAIGLITVVDVNDAAVQLCRAARREELLGSVLLSVDLEDQLVFSSFMRQIAALFEGQTSLFQESKLVTFEGVILDVMIYAYFPPERDVQAHMLVSVADITEQRSIVRELRRSEEQFRSIVETSVDSIIILDDSGSVIFWNEAAERTLGYTAGEAVGMNAEVFVASKRIRDLKALAKSVKEVKGSLRDLGLIETTAVRRNGERFPVEFTIASWTTGSESYFTIVVRDISERKSARALLESQARLLDIASDAIVVVDTERRIQYWNKSAERLFGWSAAEALGRVQNELLSSSDYVDELGDAQKIALTSGHWTGESHYATKDGGVLTGESRLTRVTDPAGVPTGILSVTTDMTARKVMERELLRFQRLESIGTLAGGVAHDLNNVLTPIVTGVEALMMESQNERNRRLLEIIRRSALRGASIIHQLLDFAKGVDGERSVVDVAQVLSDIRSIVSETFPKGISLDVAVQDNIWPIRGEATQIQQVLMNLCLNARDAMPSGGRLSLRAENATLDASDLKAQVEAKPGPYVKLEVQDSGVGMAPALAERVFDPFFTTKETGKGTGLGLSTSLSIVRSHGGFFRLDSEMGKGTTFSVILPATSSSVGRTNDEEPAPGGSGELILVADDEELVVQTTRGILEANGYRVAAASDGAELLAAFINRESEVDLVVTDMVMPSLDGLGAVRAIRRLNTDIPVVLMSGLRQNIDSPALKELAINAVLSKPFTSDSLLHTVNRVLTTKREERQ